MTATTPTTIRGVSILSSQKKRGQEVFEMALSHDGIEVRRPGRPVQQMSWDGVSEWEIEERKGYVLLTLRGQGATTPLVVPGWSLDDLEVVMRDATSGGTAHEPNVPEPVAVETDEGTSAAVAVAATEAPAPPDVPQPASEAPPPAPDAPAPAAAPTRAQRKLETERATRRRPRWKVVVTVVLLGLLAAAVILVLLQSAGVIHWSFLGPVA